MTTNVDLLPHFEEALLILYNESRLETLVKLIVRLISIFEHFHCNNIAAWKAANRIVSCTIVLGKPVHGVFARIARKLLVYPKKQIAALENLFHRSQEHFIRYTYLTSLQYTIVGDNLEEKLNEFDERLFDLVQELVGVSGVKQNALGGVTFELPINYKDYIKGNIRSMVANLVSNVEFLQEFASSSNIEVFREPGAALLDFSVRNKCKRVLPDRTRNNYNETIIDIINGDLEVKYSDKFIELVIDVFDFNECLLELTRKATAELKFSAHAVISQHAMRLFWASDIGKFDGVYVNEFCEILERRLMESTGDSSSVQRLVASLGTAMHAPGGTLFHVLKRNVDLDRNGYLIDAVDVAFLSRGLNSEEQDLEIVLGELIHSTLPYRQYPSSPLLASGDYVAVRSQSALDKISFVGASGPISETGSYADIDNSKPLHVFIDDNVEMELFSLLFGDSCGIVEVFGPKGCGKSTLLLYVVNKYGDDASRNAPTTATTSQNIPSDVPSVLLKQNVLWVDFTGVVNIPQAISRLKHQLGIRRTAIGDPIGTFMLALKEYFLAVEKDSNNCTMRNVIIFDNIDTGCIHQQSLRKIPSRAQPLLLFLWMLVDLCEELQQRKVHRFIFVGTTPISECSIVEVKSMRPVTISHSSTTGLSNILHFTQRFKFPCLELSLLKEMAKALLPIDPQALVTASLESPGEMVALAQFCSLTTIREIASFIESSILANTVFGVPRTTSFKQNGDHLSEESLAIALSSLSAEDSREIYCKYRHYVVSSAIHDFIDDLSSDEKLLATCLSGQMNLFHTILPASSSNSSLNFSTFYPFDAEVIWSVTMKEFDEDLPRWWLAWQGLIRSGWLIHSPHLGYAIRNPPWYLDINGCIPLPSAEMSEEPQAGVSIQCELGPYLHYNWAEEFSPSLDLEVVERLWLNYLQHWSKFLDEMYLPSVYHSRVVDHLDRHFIHFDNLLRIFTAEYSGLFQGSESDDFIPNEIEAVSYANSSSVGSTTIDTTNIGSDSPVNLQQQQQEQQQLEESRHTVAQKMMLKIARSVAGKLSSVLDHCLPPALGIEIAATISKLVNRYPDPQNTAVNVRIAAIMSDLDLIRQYLRSGSVSQALDALNRIHVKYSVNFTQYTNLVIGQNASRSASEFTTTDGNYSIIPLSSDANKDIGIPCQILSQVLSLRGKIMRVQGLQAESGILLAHSLVWWQRSMGINVDEMHNGHGAAVAGGSGAENSSNRRNDKRSNKPRHWSISTLLGLGNSSYQTANSIEGAGVSHPSSPIGAGSAIALTVSPSVDVGNTKDGRRGGDETLIRVAESSDVVENFKADEMASARSKAAPTASILNSKPSQDSARGKNPPHQHAVAATTVQNVPASCTCIVC